MKRSILKLLAFAAVLMVLLSLNSGAQAGLLEEPVHLYSQASGDSLWAIPISGQNQGTQNSQPESTTIGNALPQSGGGTSSSNLSDQELANLANDPTAPVTSIQFRDIYIPDAKVQNGLLNTLDIQPVVPIGPFEWLPLVQLMKITMPLVSTTPEPGSVTGMGDLQLFDLFMINQSWGRWGVGPILVFPTATNKELGAGKYQAGPAVGAVYTGINNLIAGAVLQNPFSFAGDSNRLSVNQMIVSPALYYNFEGGWSIGLTDYDWTFNWKDDGAALIPIGLQVGKVVRIGNQPISLSIEAGRAVARPSDMPDPGWIFGFEITPIFNFHIGPNGK